MSESANYTPPKVWKWDAETGGQWSKINRPVAGATKDHVLAIGKHPLQLYSLATPNGVKVTVMLEELLAKGHTGAEYDAHLIRIMDGDQFGSGFVDINPNSKIPAMMDHSTTPPTRLFESGSILMYLAEKFDEFIPSDAAGRAECFNWLFWQMGSAPYLGGGFGHFYKYAPFPIEYCIDRFTMETKRQLDVLDRNLRGRRIPRRRQLQKRQPLGRGHRQASRRSSRNEGQSRHGPPRRPAPRAPRRQRLRHQDPGQTRILTPLSTYEGKHRKR